MDPSLSIAPGNESASHAGVNEQFQTVDGNICFFHKQKYSFLVISKCSIYVIRNCGHYF